MKRWGRKTPAVGKAAPRIRWTRTWRGPGQHHYAREERIEVLERPAAQIPTCEEYVERYLREYARRHKPSSLRAQTSRLRRFRKDFRDRSLDLDRAELKQWVFGEGSWSERGPIPNGEISALMSLYNHAIDEDELPVTRSPARKLAQRYQGRVEQPPPTRLEFDALVDACSALGEYGPTMRALLLFGAYTLMRPGELYALEWTDIDFRRMRIRKARRVYRGVTEEPKTGPKTIALTPPARDAIKSLPRHSRLVFTSKRGRQLSSRTISHYWNVVLAAAGLNYHFYHATKHFGVHYMWTELGMSPRAIAAQAGWKLENANRMLAVYGHGEVGALREIDAAFYGSVGFPSRAVAARLDSWTS